MTNFDDNDESNEIVNKLIKDNQRVLFIHFNIIWLIWINQEKIYLMVYVTIKK